MQSKILTTVPYEVPHQTAREFVPRHIGKGIVKVYAASPNFWAVFRTDEGCFKVQFATLLGVADVAHSVSVEGLADFCQHTCHLSTLIQIARELAWQDLAQALAQRQPLAAKAKSDGLTR